MALAALFLVLWLSGCGREVKLSELTGTWVVTQESRERFPLGLRDDLGLLTLDSDGLFTARELPGEIFGQNKRSVSGSGRWVFEEDDESMRLDLLDIVAGDRALVPYSTQVDVFSSGSSLRLRYYIGDPDQLNTIDLQK
jgi:hypothetical protein